MSSFFTITLAYFRIPRWAPSIAGGRRIAAGLFWRLSWCLFWAASGMAASDMVLAETIDETSVETAYVIDRVLVGVYQDKTQSGDALEVLPTGAALSVLSREEKLVKARTADGIVGWVDGDYLMPEKPAQLLLLELEVAHEQAKARLRELTGEEFIADEEFIDREADPDRPRPMDVAGESSARTRAESRSPSLASSLTHGSLTYGQWGSFIAGFLLALFSSGYIVHRWIRYRYYLVERA